MEEAKAKGSSWLKIFTDVAKGPECSQRRAVGITQKLACDSPSLRTENLSVTATWGKRTTQGGQAKPHQQHLAPGDRDSRTSWVGPRPLGPRALKTNLLAFCGITGTDASGNLSEVLFQSFKKGLGDARGGVWERK